MSLLRRFPLFKRFPRLRWRPDAKPQQIINEIIEPGFQARYPALIADFDLLERHLMPDFRRLDNEALRRQNQFRRDQVILLLGGVAVTTLGAFQVTLAATHSSYWVGLAEAVVAALLASVAQLARASNAQQRYFSSRLKAETLRSEYFFFLRRIRFYKDEQTREQHLRQRVYEITRPTNDPQQSPFLSRMLSEADQQAMSDMGEREQQFWKFYRKYRYEDQLNYYDARVEEYQKAHTQATILTTVLMTLATLVSLFGSANLLDFSTGWAVLAVFFPALAAALSTYDSLYAFERIAKLFEDAVSALRHVEVYQSPGAGPAASLHSFIDQVENVFTTEQGQWGQLTSQIKVATAPETVADVGGET